jgi:hypothetical protein
MKVTLTLILPQPPREGDNIEPFWMPASAGMTRGAWIPASAGMTKEGAGMTNKELDSGSSPE